jgi:hypothetical protein
VTDPQEHVIAVIVALHHPSPLQLAMLRDTGRVFVGSNQKSTHAKARADELRSFMLSLPLTCTMRLLTNSWCFEIVVSLV